MKLCTKCAGYLPDSRFAILRARNGGFRLASWCHTCIATNRKTPMRDLTAEALKAQLHYDPTTGIFTRVMNSTRPDLIGKAAGTLRPASTGYQTISVARKRYYAHRLAWLYMTGEWPQIIDHINGDRTDNRWANLRSVTQVVNAQNVHGAQSDNKSGFLGAHFCKTTGRYRAMLRVGKKYMHLGRFDTAQEAHAAYVEAKRQHHEGNTL